MLVLENCKLLAKGCVFDDEVFAPHAGSADDVDDESEYHAQHNAERSTYEYQSQ
jgi:hypothetical protein